MLIICYCENKSDSKSTITLHQKFLTFNLKHHLSFDCHSLLRKLYHLKG